MSTVQELLNLKGHAIWSIPPRTTAYEALEILADKNIGALLVVEEEKLVGIFSERDYARKVILKGKSSKDTPVSELMTADVLTASPADSLDRCLKVMTDYHIRHLPVLDAGRLAGVLTIGDVIKYIISHQQQTIQNLEEYIASR
jgi:CBS domain-containing protein